ncbi:hypothetical protein MIR68_000138 [Amoeboaphelidium protococcarum]|nr:hypothetical protein MIR68_000138 [Amoeboaphelidium protococcarum]
MMSEQVEKYVNCPIQGLIPLTRLQLRYIDSQQFQRLRELKQLGTASYVYPGATHTRFEHSIGTSTVARAMLKHLPTASQQLDISEFQYESVILAGLLHDIGHGPYSHIFDGAFIPQSKQQNTGWTHEKGSLMMIDYLVDDNGIDIDTDQLKFVKSLVMGEPMYSNQEYGYLYDIVSNKRNGVDVDKFDYLRRDCYYVGESSTYDSSRLIINSKVLDNQIVWNKKDDWNLHRLFQSRLNLHRSVYTHKTCKSVELMLIDALQIADEELGISDSILHPQEYMNMTDGVVRDIERSKSERLQPARQILRRLRKRHLYKFVDELRLNPASAELVFQGRKMDDVISAEKIVECQDINQPFRLEASDVVVSFVHLNFGMKDKNPLENIRFFNKFNPDVSFKIDQEDLSYLTPVCFQELTIYVFSRDATKVPAVQIAFRRFMASLQRDIQIERNGSSTLGSLDSDNLNAAAAAGSNTFHVRASPYSPSKVDKLMTKVPDQETWNAMAEVNGWSPRNSQMGRGILSMSDDGNSFTDRLPPQ